MIRFSEVVGGGSQRRLIFGSTATLIAMGIIALGGLAFWAAAAKQFAAPTVGRGAALFSVATLLVYLANMGLPIAVGRYAMEDTIDDRSRLCLAGWALTAALIAATLLFEVLAGPVYDLELGLAELGIFALAVVGLGLSAIVDVRLLSLRMWRLVVVRASVVALARLPILWLSPGDADAIWLFAAASIPDALTGIFGMVVLGRGGIRSMVERRRLPEQVVEGFRYAGVQYFSQLLLQAPIILIPVIVLATVTAAENAVFYIAWSIAMVAFVVPQAVARTLLTEGGRDGARLDDQVRSTLALSGGLMAVVTILSIPGAFLITTLFGPDYQRAAELLPVMVLSGVLWSVGAVLVSRARVIQQSSATLTITATFAVSCVVPALWLTEAFGLAGAAGAWLFGNIVTAIVAVNTTRGTTIWRPAKVADVRTTCVQPLSTVVPVKPVSAAQ